MPSPMFSVRSEYRAPARDISTLVNACGTEGCRSPGNIPRAYGMLNAERSTFGSNIPSPPGSVRPLFHGYESPAKESALSTAEDAEGSYFAASIGWNRWAPFSVENKPNHPAYSTHSWGISPLRGNHYNNNQNLDNYDEKYEHMNNASAGGRLVL